MTIEMHDTANTLKTPQEQMVLVDEQDVQIGSAGKLEAHQNGLLHRAFSIFLIDEMGRILLQRRSAAKYHSGGLWANTCCGHPRIGEPTQEGASRRLHEELNMNAPLQYGFATRYRASLDNQMIENEFVHVFFGRTAAKPIPNTDEVAEVDWVTINQLSSAILAKPENYAVWLRHYFGSCYAQLEHHMSTMQSSA